eukprot:7708695-Alexandrium_andersonii.AAC.1
MKLDLDAPVVPTGGGRNAPALLARATDRGCTVGTADEAVEEDTHEEVVGAEAGVLEARTVHPPEHACTSIAGRA